MWWSVGEKFIGNLDKLGVLIHPQRKRFSLRPFLEGVADNTNASAADRATLNIVAHEDDDLLFLSPDLLHAIQAGRNVRTIFLTAGDSGTGADHWQSRESGVQAAYAQMCGVANSWIQADAGIAEHPIPVFMLSGHPSVSVAFMRLPDGNIDGSGFASTNHKSLQHLWVGSISTIDAVDGSSSYSKATLISTLTGLMSSFQPDQINTQDFVGTYGDGDHSDHHSVAYLVQAAVQQYTTPYILTGYEGYTTSFRLANITGVDLTAKQDAFYAYAHHDRVVGGVPEIFPKSWRMSVRVRRIVFLLRSLPSRTRYLLKSVAHLLVRKSASSYDDATFLAWLRRQYMVSSRSCGGNSQLIANTGSNQVTQHSEGKGVSPFLAGIRVVTLQCNLAQELDREIR
jgi:LmbE family N-acetylglucosaminyl deacetylase